MKVILFGYGSIGQRHAANLKVLRPDVELFRYDPPKRMRIIDPPDHYDAAIIASPTECHADAMDALAQTETPFYVEKPLGAHSVPAFTRCAVGHQYRFHPAMPAIRAAAERTGVLHFRAYDDLLERYGPNVDEAIAAHPIDTALWLLGPALEVAIKSNGVIFHGSIKHERGISTHDYIIDSGPRVSNVTSGKTYDLPANNEMYLDALRAWLEWVEGGERDPRTCTLAEGLAVMEVLAKVKRA